MNRLQNLQILFSHIHTAFFSGKVISILKILSLVLVFSGVIGCRSSKDVVKKPSVSDVKRLDQLVFEHGNFEYLSSKVDFKFMPKAGVSAGMRGTIKLRRDSCLIISIQPFAGIEAVKCLIRKDSIFIVSRLHQTYAVEDLSVLKGFPYLNLELVQSILFNKIFVLGKTNLTPKDLSKFEWHKQKDGNYFRWPDQDYIFDFCLNNEGLYSDFKASNPEKKQKIQITYSLFQDKTAGEMPYRILFSNEGFKNAFKFQMTYLKPNFETPDSFRFEIPSKYKKETTIELFKRFQKML